VRLFAKVNRDRECIIVELARSFVVSAAPDRIFRKGKLGLAVREEKMAGGFSRYHSHCGAGSATAS
jgi:hypothetical protein